ncbi:uncharacterized protein P884DRAFT_27899 [Thermothelomyces heterothallicus CBS 202.75]|uniref:uncharacterized protein n=1 Tax=Thermothelomyces heterothallicus CBS 202.75 TaxID=1149848 RepID=UPI003742D691
MCGRCILLCIVSRLGFGALAFLRSRTCGEFFPPQRQAEPDIINRGSVCSFSLFLFYPILEETGIWANSGNSLGLACAGNATDGIVVVMRKGKKGRAEGRPGFDEQPPPHLLFLFPSLPYPIITMYISQSAQLFLSKGAQLMNHLLCIPRMCFAGARPLKSNDQNLA